MNALGIVGLSDPRRLYKAPVHARLFVRHHGIVGPFACVFCEEPVLLLTGTYSGVVHHLDGNHDNNTLANLAPAHRRCHGKHHHTDRQFTLEHRQRISAALKAKGIRPPLGSGGRAQKGVPKSDAHRAAMSEGQRQRWAQRKAS